MTVGPISKCSENIECLTIELNCNGHKILIICMYKNPKMNPNDFKRYFEEICETIMDKYEHVIIIGDLNFNMSQNNTLSTLCPVYNLTKHRKYLKGFSIDTGISSFTFS